LKFDDVHDIQQAYRKLVDCNANPGRVHSLRIESEKMGFPIYCNKALLVLARMLLDTEVCFHVIGKASEIISNTISQLTYTVAAPLDEADYVFVAADADSKELIASIIKCKLGDLINPHSSATLIIEAEKITEDRDLMLRGPGIKESNYLCVETAADWVTARAVKNIEYPLGIEIYFVDKEYRIAALPRTTVIQSRGDKAWAM